MGTDGQRTDDEMERMTTQGYYKNRLGGLAVGRKFDLTTPHHHLHLFQHCCEGPNSVHNITTLHYV
jgi:hypothetical protein